MIQTLFVIFEFDRSDEDGELVPFTIGVVPPEPKVIHVRLAHMNCSLVGMCLDSFQAGLEKKQF